MPVLVINGRLDLDTRRDAGTALARAIAGALHREIPAAAHLPNLDAPAAYDAALDELLAASAPPVEPRHEATRAG
jgi:pimeloyl-ACP methyl ester carboxylesterase